MTRRKRNKSLYHSGIPAYHSSKLRLRRGTLVSLVKALMTLRGFSQADLARRAGISATTLSRYLNETSDLRADGLLKVLESLGADPNSVLRSEINKVLGTVDEMSVGDDIRVLLEMASPIIRKTVTETLISSFKNEKSPETKNRIMRLKKYRDSIRTVRRNAC